jgi:hypothetical protein
MGKLQKIPLDDLAHGLALVLHRNADILRDPRGKARLRPSFEICFEIARRQVADLVKREAEIYVPVATSHSFPARQADG